MGPTWIERIVCAMQANVISFTCYNDIGELEDFGEMPSRDDIGRMEER